MLTKALIIKLITVMALKHGIKPSVAIAVAIKESNLNPNAIGQLHEVGLFQLLPSSFPNYSIEQLKDPKLNIKLGIKYLAETKKNCIHRDGLNYLVCYNYGYKNARKVKHPNLFPYVKDIKLIIAKNDKL